MGGGGVRGNGGYKGGLCGGGLGGGVLGDGIVIIVHPGIRGGLLGVGKEGRGGGTGDEYIAFWLV